jgi:hypothetical protein
MEPYVASTFYLGGGLKDIHDPNSQNENEGTAEPHPLVPRPMNESTTVLWSCWPSPSVY